MTTPIVLRREQILAHRRRMGELDRRLAPGPDSWRRVAASGLQDSMPRAAVLSLHARVTGVPADVWEHPALAQVWGPRFSAYVVAREDVPVFTLGRSPVDAARRRRGEDLADRLERLLDGGRMSYAEAGRALGVQPNALRYAAPTGRVLLRWDGARRPDVWVVPPPEMDPGEARRELARRHFAFFGPGTAASLSTWAGITAQAARAVTEALRDELTPVQTPIGPAFALTSQLDSLTGEADAADGVRLLPSGDALTLLAGEGRAILVPDVDRRGLLWTPRVWPGAVMIGGEVAGTWRRSGRVVTVDRWRAFTPGERAAVEDEAAAFPLPDLEDVRVEWSA